MSQGGVCLHSAQYALQDLPGDRFSVGSPPRLMMGPRRSSLSQGQLRVAVAGVGEATLLVAGGHGGRVQGDGVRGEPLQAEPRDEVGHCGLRCRQGGQVVRPAESHEPLRPGSVTGPGGCGQGVGQEVSKVPAHRVVRIPGVAVGVLSACGAREKNL